jgi:hypothetical protein
MDFAHSVRSLSPLLVQSMQCVTKRGTSDRTEVEEFCTMMYDEMNGVCNKDWKTRKEQTT